MNSYVKTALQQAVSVGRRKHFVSCRAKYPPSSPPSSKVTDIAEKILLATSSEIDLDQAMIAFCINYITAQTKF